ncbi:hypothetical protein [Deinococcus radiotolerans]|uniref:Uncharacterized protein n=1 Tax=Deinococcus radiotolerans TaxID=1309407 RepID=A0ABQ2FPX8_9DEIO|nr:hypothetical protein [Deinococcus radiotolerans]GGL15336.1 hypothetical protein GCM10010844_37680 [Deinococcus radiotolerans]
MTTRTLPAPRPQTTRRSLSALALATLSLSALIAPQRAYAAPADMTGT